MTARQSTAAWPTSAMARRLAAQTSEAARLGVEGTPSFLLNGELLAGTHDWQSLEGAAGCAAIAAEQAKLWRYPPYFAPLPSINTAVGLALTARIIEGSHPMIFRRSAPSLIAASLAPLALGLASCGKAKDEIAGLSGEPIAKIAAPAGKAWADMVAKTPEGGYLMGNPAAPIKLVEYGSFTCSHCAEFSEKSSVEIRDTFVASGRVSFEFRNFVRDAMDITAAMLTRCGAPESYFALTEQAFTYQAEMFQKVQKAGDPAFDAAIAQPDDKRGIAIGELTGLTEFFAARGISKDQANACLTNAAEAAALAKRTTDDAEKFKIEGTPLS